MVFELPAVFLGITNIDFVLAFLPSSSSEQMCWGRCCTQYSQWPNCRMRLNSNFEQMLPPILFYQVPLLQEFDLKKTPHPFYRFKQISLTHLCYQFPLQFALLCKLGRLRKKSLKHQFKRLDLSSSVKLCKCTYIELLIVVPEIKMKDTNG